MAFKKFTKALARKAKKRYIKRSGKGKTTLKVSKIVKDLNYVKSVLNVEHKQAELRIGTAAHANISPIAVNVGAPQLRNVFSPAGGNWLLQGTQSAQRVGTQVRITSITNKLAVRFRNVNEALAFTNLRMYMLYFHDAQITPTVQDIVEHDANGNYSPMSFWRPSYAKNYKIIRRYKFFPPRAQFAGTSTQDQIYQLADHFTTDLRPRWSDDDQTTLERGRIWILLLSDNSASSDSITLEGNIRFNYVDN